MRLSHNAPYLGRIVMYNGVHRKSEGAAEMECAETVFDESDTGLSEEHLRDKRKRFVSRERQRHHRQRLLCELSHGNCCKPSIWRECKWDDALGTFVDTHRIRRGKRSSTQKILKKASCRTVRHLPAEPWPKGNYYRKIFDYWWIWL